MTGTQYVYDGSAWVSTTPTAPAPDVQTFTSSGTYTPPEGAEYVDIDLIGAAAGGPRHNTTSLNGGPGGSHVHVRVPASAFAGASATVTIGAGGAGSTYVGTGTGTGGTGGNTVVIATGYWSYTAKGGIGSGADNTPPQYGSPGATNPTTDSLYGGGCGGAGNDGAGSLGGTWATEAGWLKAGNGGHGGTTADATPGEAPGGGGGAGKGVGRNGADGARGEARFTAYF